MNVCGVDECGQSLLTDCHQHLHLFNYSGLTCRGDALVILTQAVMTVEMIQAVVDDKPLCALEQNYHFIKQMCSHYTC